MTEEAVDVLRENDSYVESLQTAVDRGEFSLELLPELIVRIVSEDRWQRRYVRALQREVSFERFSDFIAAKMPEGLGASAKMLRLMCQDNVQARAILEEELQGKPGTPVGNKNASSIKTTVDNINSCLKEERPDGTSADYALRRLRNAAPGLHARVIRGELTPHAAMVEAGFRKRMISIPVADADRAARSIIANASPEFIDELIEALERNRTIEADQRVTTPPQE